MPEDTKVRHDNFSPAEKHQMAKRAAVASLVGTAVEWYDYFLFGTASALVFGAVFFPDDTPLIGTLSAFAVFGVGFFARPLGGIVFGHMGDRIGRKRTLVVTLMIMGIATFAIGLLPTAAQVGVLAPILLVALRLLQGFAAGGEWGGAALVAVEYAPEGKRGTYGTFPPVGNTIGQLASTGIWLLVSALPDDQLFSWGWRVPFLASIVLVVVGLLIRLKLTETPAFRAAQAELEEQQAAGHHTETSPFAALLRTSRRPLLIAMGMRLGEGILAYVVLTVVLTYATSYTKLSRSDVLAALTVASALGAVTFYLLGRLSDRIGRRPVFMVGAAIGIVFAFPVFWILDTNSVVGLYMAVAVIYSVGVGAMYAVESSLFSELFGTRVRYSGMSAAVQLPSILVGAWPFAATAMLVATDGNPWPISITTIIVVGIGLVCARLAPETRHVDLNRIGRG
ncbi:MFS transporter [Mycolicibacterium agri]|uniref:Putative proline/betaine transporter n=1 Tax=Mycolicibacterium agri TaxID=36811 RepID=A0A2A7MV10_MYCAG|nr:MFS transporter [Mycolicibacterium agri]PEG35151.1 MFS transporter [Mycolicibacterium agri]GFG52902.1 MFS transporter [Mycolicibacterium agri]